MKPRAPRALPLLDEVTLLARLWPELDSFVNGPPPTPTISQAALDDTGDDMGAVIPDHSLPADSQLHAELRRMLRAVIDPTADAKVARELARSRAAFPLALGPEHQIYVPRVSNHSEQRERYYFTVLLLRRPALRPLLRVCDHCGRFTLGTRAHRREHSFCTPECRFLFHRQRRGKDAHAEYMRGYRRLQSRLRRKKTPRAKRRQR